MSQIRRFAFAIKVTLMFSFVAIIHFRFGVDHLYPMATTTFAGPFSPAVETLEFTVPLAIAFIVVVTWAWVLVSPVQEERTVRRAPRR